METKTEINNIILECNNIDQDKINEDKINEEIKILIISLLIRKL